ncbi:MAG: FtsX-like permease family protein, partial [Bryobacteraceae bacterium]
RQSGILAMVVKEGLRLILAGLVLGLAGAALLGRFLASLLYNVTPADPATFVTVAALLISVALIATAVPALRAARVDPMAALRQE